jgi:hypothetical protein
MPRASRRAAREPAAMPFPRDETTPPVTKINLVLVLLTIENHILKTKNSTIEERDSNYAAREFKTGSILTNARAFNNQDSD